MNFEFVNWWAVLGATVVSFLLGGIWYMPAVFGRVGLPERQATERPNERNIELIFVFAFVLQWLTASMLAAVLGPNPTVYTGVMTGLLVGSFFVATASGISVIFDRRPVARFLVNGGFHIVTLAVMGAIIAAGNLSRARDVD